MDFICATEYSVKFVKKKTRQDDRNEASPDKRSLLSNPVFFFALVLTAHIYVFSYTQSSMHCFGYCRCSSFRPIIFSFAFYQFALNECCKIREEKRDKRRKVQSEFKMKWKRHQCCRRF